MVKTEDMMSPIIEYQFQTIAKVFLTHKEDRKIMEEDKDGFAICAKKNAGFVCQIISVCSELKKPVIVLYSHPL